MEMLKLKLKNGEEINVEKETTIYEVIKKNSLEKDIPIVLGKINGELHELTHKLESSGELLTVDITDPVGLKVYERTLVFVLIKVVLDLYPDAKVTIEHTLGKGIYGEIHKGEDLTEEDIKKIKIRMRQLVEAKIKINKVILKREKAINIFSSYGMEDKIKLLKYMQSEEVRLYELDGRYDYFYGSMAYSTEILKVFELDFHKPGFLLRFPSTKSPNKISEYVSQDKLESIFYETEKWGNILEVGDVGSLNNKVVNGEISNIIRVSEALHEKKIAYISDMISEKENVKVVLIAGPSSSGKTTFSKRLGIQLRVNGCIPVPISLDDYFVDREHTPRDENGEYDFESIMALDLELFNSNIKDLMEGKEVELPSFNFKKGQREWTNKKIKLPENGVIIIEGIHGLNEMLTSSIPKENKFKIYISALTQLNLDDHNRISTTDVRMLRRIVRDYLSRGYGGEDTLKMWPSIRKGEEKNIFVFQEQADAMFNSTLVYELCVLKKYALVELAKIDSKSPVYYEAVRLRRFLNFFMDIDRDLVPDNSILREFVGGSYFYRY
ncbi:MAG: nucleoside kinase [Bacillota bacterium]|nr:nucleoside kinase [Bacillota bacterium]